MPPSGPGQWAIRNWTGVVQNQDRASSTDEMLVDHRPSGLLMTSPTITLITLLTGLRLGLQKIVLKFRIGLFHFPRVFIDFEILHSSL